jgi:antitoxin component YwqK of YwqJK toxin-antitoxin module
MIRFLTLFMIVALGVSCGNNTSEIITEVATPSTPLPEMYANHNIYDLGNTNHIKRATEVGQDRYYESGILVNGKKEGPWVYYYHKAGTPKIVSNYENDTLNGPYTEYTDFGWVKVSANCKAGEFHGDYSEFEESVIIKKQTFVEGKLEGEAITYYLETEMNKSRLNYKDGKQHGIATYFDKKGNAIQEYTYENGEQVSSRELK